MTVVGELDRNNLQFILVCRQEYLLLDMSKAILPDEFGLRSLHAIEHDPNWADPFSIEVGPDSRHFVVKDGNIYNRKGTILKYHQRKLSRMPALCNFPGCDL